MIRVLGDHPMLRTPRAVGRKGLGRVPISSLYVCRFLRLFASLMIFKVNRNKKSLGLSFQHKSGVEILHKLAENCDVLVENYLPGALKKYGMDYETLAKINPKLIYASITGYGQNGPYSNRAGYDVMVEASVSTKFLSDCH